MPPGSIPPLLLCEAGKGLPRPGIAGLHAVRSRRKCQWQSTTVVSAAGTSIVCNGPPRPSRTNPWKRPAASRKTSPGDPACGTDGLDPRRHLANGRVAALGSVVHVAGALGYALTILISRAVR